MTELLSNLLHETAGANALNALTGTAIGYFYAFTFVMLRMAGLMTIGPVFGHPGLPVNVRVLLVVALSMLVTPAIFAEAPWQTIAKYDVNGDGRLSIDEAPVKMQPRIARLLESAPPGRQDAVSPQQLVTSIEPPKSLVDYLWSGVGEFSLGLVLGIGVTIILSGLQLAGHMIDQQSGTAVGEIFNPAFNTSETVTARLLSWLGLAIFLAVDGQLSMVSALLETYQAFPIGEGFVDSGAIDLLHNLFIRSLALALQVAAPVLAVMSLIAVTMGFLGLSVPQVNVLVVGFPIRATISLVVVSLTLVGAGGVIVEAVEMCIEQLEYAIVGVPPL
ncbi:Flagellar biosynthetic protein FliR [Symmachiella dynata]|uniref:Flagellar biosynthetic protein FliR n=1 Tax=Symmachiella dynata TaxID=2527995 RepID=A0A517ZGQ3_9PLAN|nr:flagellar biosynthetic protein FliR [Symmachiella dynata]QDU41655.1 Flagellar biosynthetic protein FliR [Symmachiella dynata]